MPAKKWYSYIEAAFEQEFAKLGYTFDVSDWQDKHPSVARIIRTSELGHVLEPGAKYTKLLSPHISGSIYTCLKGRGPHKELYLYGLITHDIIEKMLKHLQPKKADVTLACFFPNIAEEYHFETRSGPQGVHTRWKQLDQFPKTLPQDVAIERINTNLYYIKSYLIAWIERYSSLESIIEALEDRRKSKLSQLPVDICYRLSLAYMLAGRFDDAQRAIKKALEVALPAHCISQSVSDQILELCAKRRLPLYEADS